jgi:hypothetical protein
VNEKGQNGYNKYWIKKLLIAGWCNQKRRAVIVSRGRKYKGRQTFTQIRGCSDMPQQINTAQTGIHMSGADLNMPFISCGGFI